MMAVDKIAFSKRYIIMKDGGKIALWDSGGATTPIIFIHGFPENHKCWNALLSAFPPQTHKDYRYIIYDLRGFGESSKKGEASITSFYEDHQTIVSELQLPSYHLVGHDWGGAVALQTARFNPTSLKSATVMNTNFWKTNILGMWHLIFLNLPFLPRLSFRCFPNQLFRFGVVRSYLNPSCLDPQTLQSYLQMFCDPDTTQYWIKLYRNMAKLLMLQRFPFLEPVLARNQTRFPERPPNAYQLNVMLIWGEEDRFAPIRIGKDMKKNLVKRGAEVTFHTIPEAGHFVQEDQPSKIVPLLLEHWHTTKNNKGKIKGKF